MPRAKRGFKARRRRKKLLGMAKGYYGSKSRAYTIAAQQMLKSLVYAYIGRKNKKRDFRENQCNPYSIRVIIFDLKSAGKEWEALKIYPPKT